MNFNFTRILALVIGIVFFYASCKKSENKPGIQNTGGNQTTLDYKALSSQMALNLYNSLYMKYSGVPNSGNQVTVGNHNNANAASRFTSPLASNINPYCGFIIDSAFSYTAPPGDTTETSSGTIKFVYTCSTTQVDGYSATSVDTIIQSNSHFRNFQVVNDEFVVKALEQTYKLVSLHGHMTDAMSYVRFDGPFYSPFGLLVNSDAIVSNSAYMLTGFTIDLTSGKANITAGTATFNDTNTETDVNNPNGKSYDYQGTIVFLGGNKVKVTFTQGALGNAVFIVDLVTGIATAG